MMLGGFLIRRAEPSDAKSLSSLARRTFSETFSPHNSSDDMDAYMNEAFTVEKQAEELSDETIEAWMAFKDQEPAGYLYLRTGHRPTCVSRDASIEIQRLYIDEKFFGRGLAKTLMETGVERAQARGFKGIWLGVWEENHRALAFYKKWGFREVGDHHFKLGSDVQRDLILERQA